MGKIGDAMKAASGDSSRERTRGYSLAWLKSVTISADDDATSRGKELINYYNSFCHKCEAFEYNVNQTEQSFTDLTDLYETMVYSIALIPDDAFGNLSEDTKGLLKHLMADFGLQKFYGEFVEVYTGWHRSSKEWTKRAVDAAHDWFEMLSGFEWVKSIGTGRTSAGLPDLQETFKNAKSKIPEPYLQPVLDKLGIKEAQSKAIVAGLVMGTLRHNECGPVRENEELIKQKLCEGVCTRYMFDVADLAGEYDNDLLDILLDHERQIKQETFYRDIIWPFLANTEVVPGVRLKYGPQDGSF